VRPGLGIEERLAPRLELHALDGNAVEGEPRMRMARTMVVWKWCKREFAARLIKQLGSGRPLHSASLGAGVADREASGSRWRTACLAGDRPRPSHSRA
jgi:hypothetical protein